MLPEKEEEEEEISLRFSYNSDKIKHNKHKLLQYI
jgi:hypothetical protein